MGQAHPPPIKGADTLPIQNEPPTREEDPPNPSFWYSTWQKTFKQHHTKPPYLFKKGSKVIFVGNPGSGKSTLLNSILGRVAFKSGLSIGSGLTSRFQVEERDGVSYIDTPGLDDIEKRKDAAREIEEALRRDGGYYLFFVVTVESGRVKPSDIATMKIVLDALENIPQLSFGIIVNRVSNTLLERLKSNLGDFQKMVVSLYVKEDGRDPSFYFYGDDVSVADKDDELMEADCSFLGYLKGCECVQIRSGLVEKLKVEQFEELREKLEKEMNRLELENHKLKEYIENIEERYAIDLSLLHSKVENLEELLNMFLKMSEGETNIEKMPSYYNINLEQMKNFVHSTDSIHDIVKKAMQEHWNSKWEKMTVKVKKVILKAQSQYPQLSENMIGAFTYYTVGFGKDLHCKSLHLILNQKLRSCRRLSDIPEWVPYLAYVYQACQRLIPHNGVAYRVVDLPLKSLDNKYVVEKTITFNAFTSTTKLRSIFDTWGNDNPKRTKMVFEETSSGIPIEGLSLLPYEREVLFLPGTTFMVTKIVQDMNGPDVVYLKEFKPTDGSNFLKTF